MNNCHDKTDTYPNDTPTRSCSSVSAGNNKAGRTHRVGSITAGLCLIAMGVLFCLHIFLSSFSLELIFKLWPFMIIMLGLELLISNIFCSRFVYDKAAVFIMLMVALFAACMGAFEWCLTNGVCSL